MGYEREYNGFNGHMNGIEWGYILIGTFVQAISVCRLMIVKGGCNPVTPFSLQTSALGSSWVNRSRNHVFGTIGWGCLSPERVEGII